MEIQDEAEQVTPAIHQVHVCQDVNTIVVDVSKHLSSEILERIAKVKKDI